MPEEINRYNSRARTKLGKVGDVIGYTISGATAVGLLGGAYYIL